MVRVDFWWCYIFNRKGEKRQIIATRRCPFFYSLSLCVAVICFSFLPRPPPEFSIEAFSVVARNHPHLPTAGLREMSWIVPCQVSISQHRKALSSLAAISVGVGSLAGDVKDWVVRGVVVTLWGLCGEASWQSIKLCIIKVDELCFFTRFLSFIFSYFNFLKGGENKNLEEALMLTGVHLRPEILSLTFCAGGFFFSPFSNLGEWNYLWFYMEVPLYPLRKKGQIF